MSLAILFTHLCTHILAVFSLFGGEGDEIEHSESKLYYLGELSDAELLQSPTHTGSTEKK